MEAINLWQHRTTSEYPKISISTKSEYHRISNFTTSEYPKITNLTKSEYHRIYNLTTSEYPKISNLTKSEYHKNHIKPHQNIIKYQI